MADYEALDLSRWCNAEATELDTNEGVILGRQTLRGLPFLVGSEKGAPHGKCFIALAGSDESVTIPIGKPAYRVIVAHRLLETNFHEGGHVGRQVAEYVFRLSGGSEERVPIREKFEIGALPSNVVHWGSPFLAVSDQEASLWPRHEGPWHQAGSRQTEASGSKSRWYHLWSFKNPDPGRHIESLEIIPNGPRFIIAAVTLGLLDEHPFAREGNRLTRVVLTDSSDAQKPFDLSLEVDRGTASYTWALPEASNEEFMRDPFKGWGQEQNAASSPSYAEISAVPSATVTVKHSGKVLGGVHWGEVKTKGKVETPRVRLELVDRGKNWVHVTVLDDETGRPVPCRVHFRSPEGVPFQPYGHHNHVNSNLDSFHMDVGGDLRLGQITYAYIDGTCQGWLPRGEVLVDVARGYEYEPLRAKVTIGRGQRELTLRIKRWTNMNAQGWYSGDSHVHFLSSQGALTESRGEDLNVVNLLQSQWGSLFTNTEDFTGAPHVSRDGANIVYVSQENRQHFLGHLVMWGLKQPVMPWCTDGLGEAEIGGTLESTLSDWADRCHAQGGYVIKPHFPSRRSELNALIATGRLDAVEMLWQTRFVHQEYYRYLNCGYRLPLVGGTDKMSSDVPIGLYRTYAHLDEDEEFSYENWCKNVARGRTMLSGGPMVHLSVDGHQVGDTVKLSGAGTVEVEAWAESILPINTLQIIARGRVVASTESREGTRRLELREKLAVDGHTWIAARCGGPGYANESLTWDGQALRHHDTWRRGVFAHTSPIYVATGGEWQMFDGATAKYMLTLIDGSLAYIHETSAQHEPGTVTHHHGEDDHMAYLERPFHEAREAILERARSLGVSL